MKSLRELRYFPNLGGARPGGPAGGAGEGGEGGGGRPGPTPGPVPGTVFFFFVAQWLKRPQCVAMLPGQQRQTHTMFLQITTHYRAKYSQLASKTANELLRSSRVKLSIISLGFASFAFQTNVPGPCLLFPSLLVFKRK